MSPGAKILITGAAGEVGKILTERLQDQYDLVLTDKRQPPALLSLPFLAADITDLEAMRAACQGIDVVVHLAADRRVDAPWDSLLPNNIIGTYNIFHAAHEAGCRRVIFASSINAICGYPLEVPVAANTPVRPPNLYGASKVWGEALARFYADTTQLSCICLRFGWIKDANNLDLSPDDTNLQHVLTYGDLVRLVVASIEAPDDLQFGIFHGISNNRHRQFDIEEARRILGYQPEDDAFALASAASGGITSVTQPGTSGPTAEQELLLKAALWQGEKALHAWHAWQTKVDWNDHLDPESYRLMPLLFHNLSQHNVEDPILQKLKGIYRMVWYKNHTALRRLALLLHAFQEAEIRTMLVKGTALTVAHYPNYGLRPLNDFDVLVPIGRAADAIALLQSAGWKLEPWFTSRPIGILLATQPRLVFTDATQQKLNLHWHVLQESRGPDADESFWQAAVATALDGVPTAVLGPTDQLLQVCLDSGPSSGEASIAWIADAMTILKASSLTIDWPRLLTQAQERLLVLPLREALTYLYDVFAAPIPVAMVQKLCSKSASRMERWEARYRASGYQHRPLVDIPFFWFDYLRSRKLLTNENKLWGFVHYLQRRAEVPHLWQLPFSLLGACGRRVWRALIKLRVRD